MRRLFLNPKWMTCKIEFSIQISFLEMWNFSNKIFRLSPPAFQKFRPLGISANTTKLHLRLIWFDRWLAQAPVKTLIWILKHSSQIRQTEGLFSCGCIDQHGGIASTRINLQSKEKRYFLVAEERKKQKMFSDILLEYIDFLIGRVGWESTFCCCCLTERPPSLNPRQNHIITSCSMLVMDGCR